MQFEITRRNLIAVATASLALPAAAKTAPEPDGVRVRPDREEMVPVPGGRVYVRVNGDLAGQRAPVVFIHGGPGSGHSGFLNGTALADKRAVILYDQLDSGLSDAPGDPANWVIPRFIAELEAVRTYLGVERWHVVGGSWGGTLALEYAAGRPGEMASVTLQSPLVSTDIWLRDARLLKARMPAATRALLDGCDKPHFAPKSECDAATTAFDKRYVRLNDHAPKIAAYRSALPRKAGEEIYNAMWGRAEFTSTGTLKTYDGRPLLKKLDGRRTLFLAGEHDEAIPSTIAAFARAVPGARFHQIDGAAHSVMGDNPAAYLKILRPWLAGHDKT